MRFTTWRDPTLKSTIIWSQSARRRLITSKSTWKKWHKRKMRTSETSNPGFWMTSDGRMPRSKNSKRKSGLRKAIYSAWILRLRIKRSLTPSLEFKSCLSYAKSKVRFHLEDRWARSRRLTKNSKRRSRRWRRSLLLRSMSLRRGFSKNRKRFERCHSSITKCAWLL